MAQRKTLTEAQLEVLRWIGDGCPDEVYDPTDPAHRISAAALARRELVEVAGKGPTWTAKITTAGRAYVERANGPNPPKPRQANVSVTQALVDELIAAGGTLRLAQVPRHDPTYVDYFQRARLAERHGRVPDGKRLKVTSPSWQEVVVELIDAPEGATIEVGEVPVPERVARYHPLVRRLRDAKDRHEVSRAALNRALRILHSLVIEAERRGWEARWPETSDERRYGRPSWSGSRDGHLVFVVRDHRETVRISEEGLGSRSQWEYANRSYDRWSEEWTTPPISRYEEGATGRLQLEIIGYGGRGRQSKWADRQSWTLEEKLGELLREVELRAAEAEERRREAEREVAERKRRWEAAMEEAQRRWLEAQRGKFLEQQAERWHTAEAIRAYADAMASEAVSDEGEEWVAWSRSYADSIDPLSRGVSAPEQPEGIPAEELRPFLDGWSPHGSDGGGRW